jgi:hypothetical protein
MCVLNTSIKRQYEISFMHSVCTLENPALPLIVGLSLHEKKVIPSHHQRASRPHAFMRDLNEVKDTSFDVIFEKMRIDHEVGIRRA